MKLIDLRQYYTHHELSHFPGDMELRFRIFSPFFKILHQNKVVYYEKFICVVKLENIQITPDYLEAIAVPHLPIERSGDFRPRSPDSPWSIRTSWDWMLFGENSFSVPYVGWTIWPDAELVSEVERVTLTGNFEAALRLIGW